MVVKSDMNIFREKVLFEVPEDIPISFCYGDEKYVGIDKSFSVEMISEVKGNITKHIYTGTNSEGLKIRVECSVYGDYPVMEYVAFFTNNSNKDSKVLSKVKILNKFFEGKSGEICFGTGDTWDSRGYDVKREQLLERIILSPADGNPCNGVSPFVRLFFEEYSLNLAVGWPGKWEMICRPENGEHCGIEAMLGQARCNMKLRPGETMRTPSVTLMCFEGNEDKARNLWRRWFREYIMPRPDGKKLAPMSVLCAPMPGFVEWGGATLNQQLEALEKAKESGFIPDVFWIDAGWYECRDNYWENTGNWYPDPKRFPGGMAPIGEKCRETGTRFLLWFEPERARSNSELWDIHPEWLLMPDEVNGGESAVVNFAITECVDWIIEKVDSVIKESGVTIYREDFNIDPLPYWIKYETKDRIGAIENQHIQGRLRFWDSLIQRNSGILMDICASGGRRNEMENLRRAVPFHYTDVGYGAHPIKQKQYNYLNEWIMFYRSHIADWRDENNVYAPKTAHQADNFTLLNTITPSVMFPRIQTAVMSEEFTPIWRSAARIMLDGDFYPLTKCNKSTKEFYAVQFECPEERKGFILVINNVDNPKTKCVLHPHLLQGKKYILGESFGGGRIIFEKDGTITAVSEKADGIIQFYEY